MTEEEQLRSAFNSNLQEQLQQQLDGEIELIPFMMEWLENGTNATLAYKKLHPEVTKGSARVLGCRLLAKVSKSALLTAFSIGIEDYIKQLKAGLSAQIKDESGEVVADHKTRRIYHQVVGKLLELE